MFHIFLESVGGIFFDARIVQLVGADHVVEVHGCPKQAFVGHIGEDYSGQAACVGSKGDGVKDGEYGLAKSEHTVVSQSSDNGGIALPSYVEQGDNF